MGRYGWFNGYCHRYRNSLTTFQIWTRLFASGKGMKPNFFLSNNECLYYHFGLSSLCMATGLGKGIIRIKNQLWHVYEIGIGSQLTKKRYKTKTTNIQLHPTTYYDNFPIEEVKKRKKERKKERKKGNKNIVGFILTLELSSLCVCPRNTHHKISRHIFIHVPRMN